MQTDTSRIKERLSIIDVVGSYVRLVRAGAHWKARCPFHDEKTPSFTVNEERQSYHCFGCGKGGDIFSFVMDMDSLSFPETLRLLADRAGVELASYTPEQKAAHDERGRLSEMLSLACTFYEKQLWEGTSLARDYLLGRGMQETSLKNFHIGFAPEGWHHLEQFLLRRDYTQEELVHAGMSIAKDGDLKNGIYDRFRNRVMFPIHDPLGRVIGFSARAMPGDDAQAKYINTPETPLYHKSSVLYGIERAKNAIKEKNAVILVEGNMDVIALHQAGYENAVAVSGTAMTDTHIKLLKRYTDNFILFFDADVAGQKAARKSAQACLASDVVLSLVALSGGKDAADLVAQGDESLLDETITQAKGALDFFIGSAERDRDVRDPHDKRLIVDDVLALASHIAHPVERDAWIQTISERYEITSHIAMEIVQRHQKDGVGTQKPTPTQDATFVESEVAQQAPTVLGAQARTALVMALSFGEAWKVLVQHHEDLTFLKGDDILTILLTHGEKYQFDPDKVIAEHISSERYSEIARYRTEHDAVHAAEDMRQHIDLMRRTYLTQKHSRYLAQIDQARSRGDHEKQKILTEKVRAVQEDLEKLIE